MMIWVIPVLNSLLVLINLGIFLATLKLYTEYFKDRSQVNRKVRSMTKQELEEFYATEGGTLT